MTKTCKNGPRGPEVLWIYVYIYIGIILINKQQCDGALSGDFETMHGHVCYLSHLIRPALKKSLLLITLEKKVHQSGKKLFFWKKMS